MGKSKRLSRLWYIVDLKGFTLTEVLLTIFILALLITLITPSLKTIYKSSRSAGCIMNLKKIGIGAQMFSNDHNNFIVPTYSAPNPKSEYWYTLIAPYLGYDKIPTKIFRCPVATSLHPELAKDRLTYSLNAYISPHYVTTPQNPQILKSLTVIPNLTAKILAGDGYWLGQAYAANMTYNRNEEPHDKKSNFLFLDGHIETLGPNEYKPGRNRPNFWQLSN